MRQYFNGITPDIIRSLKNSSPEIKSENLRGNEWNAVVNKDMRSGDDFLKPEA